MTGPEAALMLLTILAWAMALFFGVLAAVMLWANRRSLRRSRELYAEWRAGNWNDQLQQELLASPVSASDPWPLDELVQALGWEKS